MAPRFEFDDPDLTHLLWVQSGVVGRRQLMEYGARDHDIDRLRRRRELTRVSTGVYAVYSGPLTRPQREWAAVLALWPAALSHRSALPVPPLGQAVHVAVDARRTLRPPRGVVPHRSRHLAERVEWRTAPPRVQLEHALIDVLSHLLAHDDAAGAFAVLTDVAFTRRTRPDRILDVLARRRRVTGRTLIAAMVSDLEDGACSVLERGYLERVERAHALPRGSRQHRRTTSGRVTYQDVRYPAYGVVVELDGLAHHRSASARDRDAGRDLAELATDDSLTVRVTYGLVFDDACRTADRIGAVLTRRGWSGRPVPCPNCA